MKEKILCIDDEVDILTTLRFALERESYRVTTAENGEDALQKMHEDLPDLVVLDWMLPGMDGLGVCRAIRADTKLAHLPIIMLTAKTEETDMVVGLEMGADDYLPKPFSNKILIARIRALLRRQEITQTPESTLIRGPFLINVTRREISYEGNIIPLTFTEFELFHLLCKHPGWVLSRTQIVEAIKGGGYPVTERAVDVQIVGLRKHLGDAGDYIETVRGVGYKFKD